MDLNGEEEVPAYLAKPLKSSGRIPAVLYNHAHGGDYALGKDELINGRRILQPEPYAKVLTSLGCQVLAIDHWAFGKRNTRKESEIFKDMLWKGQVLWGMMVFDSLRALDFLASRDDVDPLRLATLGMSMGSTMAWWLAALDTRIKVCIDIGCLTDFETFRNKNSLDAHGVYYYVPSLLKHFSTADINALIAPRAHLSLAGDLDILTPPEGLDKIDAKLKNVYAKAGVPEKWKLVRENMGHEETPRMREEILGFLEKGL